MGTLAIPPAPPHSVAAEPPLLQFRGALDRSSYLDLLAAAVRVHAQGVARLRIDLCETTRISLTGLVTLFAIAELFDGRPLPDFDEGWPAIRHMLDQAPGTWPTTPAVQLIGVPDDVNAAIVRAGLSDRFGGRAPSAGTHRHRPAA